MENTHSGKCPVMHGANTAMGSNNMNFFWPNALNLDILHQHDSKVNPLADFDYQEAVKTLDFDALKKDMIKRRALSRLALSGQELSGAKR